MAEFTATQITGLTSSPKTKMPPYDHGQIKVLIGSSPAVAAWAQNDTFKIGVIPKGSRILRTSHFWHGAFGASVTCDVGLRQTSDGTVIDADGLCAGIDVSASGIDQIKNGALLKAVNGYVTTQDVDVYATLGGANPTDDVRIEFEIYYLAPTA